jgi:uncharacterized membrane protein YgcG
MPIMAVAMLVSAIPAPVWAVAPEIKDSAKFFSPDAVAKANKDIHDIARKYQRDLLVETFITVPGDQAARVKGLSVEEREKFFANWAADRADSAVVNGVYILVSREPAHLEVFISENARGVFDRQASGKLKTLLLKSFREKHFDEGLHAAVEFVRDRLAASAKSGMQ